jgi:all-trans-8'-apo-beta-carotenal 15,15'-oxygenase
VEADLPNAHDIPYNSVHSNPMNQDHCPGIEKWLLFDAVEDDQHLEPEAGAVPRWVRGSYYVNGPARFMRGQFRYQHWLDGDGMVRAVHFNDGDIRFVSRFVRTRKLEAEESAGRPVYRTFGTAFPGDRLRREVMLEPPVNVSVYTLGSRLLAFAEQSIPVELHPVTLETGSEFDCGGKLNEVTPFSAHAKLDPRSGRLVNFGISFSASHPSLFLYEINPDGSLAGRRRFSVEAPHTNHDFAVSEHHAAFFLSPLEMDFRRFWRDGVSVMEALQWRPEKGSYILVVPRPGCDGEAFTVRREKGHCLHLVNSFEDGRTLTLDVVEFGRPIYPEYQPVPWFYQTVDRGVPVRYRIDLEARRLLDRVEMSYDHSPDFPSLDSRLIGREYDDFWMLGLSAAGKPGRKFFDELVHLRWSEGGAAGLYRAPAGCYFGGEPVFIPEPDGPGGMVMIQEFEVEADRVSFLLFDAYRVAAGPLARLPLRHKTHPGFHSSFTPAG